ncbi:MAG: DUF1049 domain-containing protein [Mastigocoleus sp. MO_167.B18]|nr:DUF1049 domain-containing protein [Mastigocoleus sp. MO_167.B18]
MKNLVNLLISLLIAFLVVFIAIVSVQNAELVYLRFFAFESIRLPFGLMLAFSFAIGIIGTAILQPLLNTIGLSWSNSRYEDDAEFFVDDGEY